MAKSNGDSAEVRLCDPKTLKNAALNIELYGEDIPEWLEASVKELGIRDPLKVCRSDNPELDGIVVSGRRRRVIAMRLGHKTVPCIDWRCDDIRLLNLELMALNVRAELTVEHRTKMFKETHIIQSQLADERMKAGDKPKPPKESNGKGGGKTGRSDEIAAKAVGFKSATTARRAAKAVDALKALETNGHVEAAKEIREELNNGSVNKAAKMAEAVVDGKPPEPPAEPVDENVRIAADQIQKLWGHLQGAHAAHKRLTAALDKIEDKSKQFIINKLISMLTLIDQGVRWEYVTNQAKEISNQWAKHVKAGASETSEE